MRSIMPYWNKSTVVSGRSSAEARMLWWNLTDLEIRKRFTERSFLSFGGVPRNVQHVIVSCWLEERLIRKTDSLNSISKSCMKFSTLVITMPNLDVMDDDETGLHRTAAAQVFAFILQALRARPPSALRHDEADRLGTWAVEYDDILRNIPATERKRQEPRASPYNPQRWKAFKQSP
ncbi:hypothetical protein EDB81DRAFT_945583 [Dactylonectria macrodidyma]|uniref:Uncharacterized protein n=1 Tax=Dactylonectria macrodidyma TaxID=307937 RepID=A0A9P9F5A2_9HYPO|nr:hypothetical protein EDB81DRAFT_945583 [Dactylonectria macrodidyma]